MFNIEQQTNFESHKSQAVLDAKVINLDALAMCVLKNNMQYIS